MIAKALNSNAGRFRTVAVAVSDYPLRRAMGEMLCDALAELGSSARVVLDGDLTALDSDLLIMIGGGRDYEKFAGLLAGRTKRPVTMLWQTESLPPPNMTAEAEQCARALKHVAWQSILGPGGAFIDRVLPARGEVARWLQKIIAGRCRRAMGKIDPRTWQNMRWSDIYFLITQADWIVNNAGPTGWIDNLVVSIAPRIDYLRRRGIAAEFVPVAYHRGWGYPLHIPKDIDVLFIGTIKTAERRDGIPRIMKELAGRGYRTHVVEQHCYGEERNQLINRSRIILNVVKFTWEFAGMRLLMGMGGHAVIVSNTCPVTAPYEAGLHFVPCELATMADTACAWLEDEQRRAAFAANAYRHMCENLTMTHAAAQLLNLAGSRNALAA